MNHIDKIIERECKGFIGDEPAACYTAKDLRALLQEVTEEYRKDAERWQAFLNCGRIKLQGWAGVGNDPKNPSVNDVGYVHFGAEFWTNSVGKKYYTDADKAQAIEVLTAFADGAMFRQKNGLDAAIAAEGK